MNRLERLLSDHGYHVLLFSLDASNPKLDIISERKLDGVFVVDVKEENFHLISSYFSIGVPLIVVDSIINDSLFYKVNYDYTDAFAQAFTLSPQQPSYVIIDSFNNAELVNHITNSTGMERNLIHVMENEQQLTTFLHNKKHEAGIVLSEFVAITAAKFTDPANLTVICTIGCPEMVPHAAAHVTFGEQKSDEAFQLMMLLLKNAAAGPKNKYINVKSTKQ